MEKKVILVLANSYKNGGRCVAWIQVRETSWEFTISKDDQGYVIWIRPVEDAGPLGINERIAGKFKIWSIVEISCLWQIIVNSYQTEDTLIGDINIRLLWILKYRDFLYSISQYNWMEILWCQQNCILVDNIKVTKSLVVIKPSKIRFYLKPREGKKDQLRAKFCLSLSKSWDLPIEDPEFIKKRCEWRHINNSEYFLTISLWIPLGEYAYLLIALVIDKNTFSFNNNYAEQSDSKELILSVTPHISNFQVRKAKSPLRWEWKIIGEDWSWNYEFLSDSSPHELRIINKAWIVIL